MTLSIDVKVHQGSFALEVALDLDDSETVAVLGPNGAGKTTLLRAISGLQPIDDGQIVIDGQVMDRPATDEFVAVHRRPIGQVFRDHLLFPRLDALDNVAFGLRARGLSKGAARAGAARWFERFDLDGLQHSRPAELSGGQAQRVALARAMALEPRLLLLDEPLAALDLTTRNLVRQQIGNHLSGYRGSRLLVTHDPIDALILADRLVILEDGRISQMGSPADVVARPASTYVADLLGLNLCRGMAAGDREVRLEGGLVLRLAERQEVGNISVAIRPQAISLARSALEGSARNCWPASIVSVQWLGDRARIALSDPVDFVAEVTAEAVRDLGLSEGLQVWASVKAVDVATFPTEQQP